MQLAFTLVFSLLSAILPKTVSASPVNFRAEAPAASLEKRFGDARLTWYNIESDTTACGQRWTSSDHVVAMDAQQFDNGAACGKWVSITVNGKTVSAQVVDDCPDCPYGALDLTRGLFQEWAEPGTGVLNGSWEFA